ncbi:MAG: hypothetical protein Kow0062_18420 [Acidobacteriota bacterium]|nr:MAG: hypothetical protein D6738_09375 [Acidobacteriota bacterium]
MTTATKTAKDSGEARKQAASDVRPDDKQVLTASQVHTIAQAIYHHLATRGGWPAWPAAPMAETGALHGAPLSGMPAAGWSWAGPVGGWPAASPAMPTPIAYWGY